MNCKEFKNRIPDYLDQKLTIDLTNRFNEHLKNCSNCSLLFEKMENTLSLLNKPDRISEQPYYYTQLKQKMENKLVQNESFWHVLQTKKVLQPVLYLGSIMIAVYIGILIGSGTPNTTQYAEKTKTDTSYIEVLAQYQYFNEMELESIEKNIFSDDSFYTNDQNK
ncbi:MAG: zf-HC2 domain-containing protein [Bacteroidales bacterium]